LGDSAVGKTSLIARYIHNEFPCHTRSHVNSDGLSIYPTIIDDQECVLTFVNVSPLDNLGELKISRKIPTACFILFSICDQRSFEKINYFQDSIHLLSSTRSISIPIIILANKADFEADRVVTHQAIERLRSDYNHIIETSVKTNQGIHEAIKTAVELLKTNFPKRKPSDSCEIL
jgi:GTPase SAR1 family protein